MPEAKVPVYVRDDDGTDHYFGVGAEVPDWAVERISNPAVFGPEDEAPEGEPDESWKVAQLKSYAAEHGIDLGDATKKADILARVTAHEA